MTLNLRKTGIATILSLGPIFGMVGCATTDGMPEYNRASTLMYDYKKANLAGRVYVSDTGVLPPIPFEVYALPGQMFENRAGVSSNIFKATGMSWTDNKLMVGDLSREEQLLYAQAIMNGAMKRLEETDPAAYNNALREKAEVLSRFRSGAHARSEAQPYKAKDHSQCEHNAVFYYDRDPNGTHDHGSAVNIFHNNKAEDGHRHRRGGGHGGWDSGEHRNHPVGLNLPNAVYGDRDDFYEYYGIDRCEPCAD